MKVLNLKNSVITNRYRIIRQVLFFLLSMKILTGVCQDAIVYGQGWGNDPHYLTKGDPPIYIITDGDGPSVNILSDNTSIKITAVGQNNYPVFPKYRFIYTERDLPQTFGTDQYCNARIKVEIDNGAISSIEMPQPLVWLPIDKGNVNGGGYVNTNNNHIFLVVKQAFIYENSEDIDCPHGPWGSIACRILPSEVLDYYNDDFAAIQADYCEDYCPFNDNFPQIWPYWNGGVTLPGPIFNGPEICQLTPAPKSEWIDGPWGAKYSNIRIYDWDDPIHPTPDEICLIVREGDEYSDEDFLGAKRISKDFQGDIFFPLWYGGWLILQNVPGGSENNIDETDNYWFPNWDGIYPDPTPVYSQPGQQFDQYHPLSICNVPTMESKFNAGEKVALLGGSLINGTYSKPMTYVAPCEPAVSREFFGVRLWEHNNYTGDSRLFTEDVQNLDRNDINFADVASSIEIINVQSVRLYNGEDYGGSVITLTQSIPNLSALGWNDIVGSIIINQ